MEKRESVSQKGLARFERVRSYVLARKALFAAQGSVAATWRTYRGRRLGPYFQVAWREGGRQRWLYLGTSQHLAGWVRDLLARLQRPRRDRRLSDRLQRQVRSSLRRCKAKLGQLLAAYGIQLKGFEFRGARRALARYAETRRAGHQFESKRVNGDSRGTALPPNRTLHGAAKQSACPFSSDTVIRAWLGRAAPTSSAKHRCSHRPWIA